MSLHLLGIGTAVPESRITRAESLKATQVLCPTLAESGWLQQVFEHTGIATRYQVIGREVLDDLLQGKNASGSPFLPHADRPHGPTTAERMMLYVRSAPRLALSAAQRALREANIPAAAIRHLITVSCTGFAAPGVDVLLIEQLGLARTVERTHIGFMGCHGALNGLRVANALTNSDPSTHVLMVAVELCSLHFHYEPDPERQIANALFADGAAAIVGHAGFAPQPWRIRSTSSCLLPDSTADMTWSIQDHGFVMTLSKRIPRIIEENLRGWVSGWLASVNRTIEDIGSWAVHPGGPKILAAVEESLGLDPAALTVSRSILHDYGNMSSPTILFILDRLRRENAPRPCVALGFGPGIVVEGTLLE